MLYEGATSTSFPLSTSPSTRCLGLACATRNDVRTRLDTDLETIRREAQLRRIGRDLHDQAADISPETVDAMAAVLMKQSPPVRMGYPEKVRDMTIGTAGSMVCLGPSIGHLR